MTEPTPIPLWQRDDIIRHMIRTRAAFVAIRDRMDPSIDPESAWHTYKALIVAIDDLLEKDKIWRAKNGIPEAAT